MRFKESYIMGKIVLAMSSIWYAFLLFLPDEYSKFRVKYYNKKGCKIHPLVTLSPNVRIRGYVVIGSGSSIAQNCSLSGEKLGIFIGENVMIAPNVCIVAFSHGFSSVDTPMVKQINTEESVVIEDDVWISSNCTIGKGVHIGKGSIIAANSFVNKDVPPYSIFGGVPAKILKTRIKTYIS